MKALNLIFPHQLFRESELLKNDLPIYLVEEYLFFTQYAFHKEKICFHRASMKAYESYLKEQGREVRYISAQEKAHDVRVLIPELIKEDIGEIHCVDPSDFWLEKRIRKACASKVQLHLHKSRSFINSKSDNKGFFRKDGKKFFQTRFYILQRKRLGILLEGADKPVGGKWSFDQENRKKYPKERRPAAMPEYTRSSHLKEGREYTEKYFRVNPGEISEKQLYPIDHEQSRMALQDFLENRFISFGPYEDAIVAEEHFLEHSVLSPLMNVGLLEPAEVVESALIFAANNDVPLNSLEGFLRQIIGWREFIRGVYEAKGVEERTRNFWGFKRKIPASFYNGTTGIHPVDHTIKKVLKTGYAHHIERLMILGNYMLLCEFDPDEVYRWFMELFIDAYDWVMVPNVYGMSQFSDGGLFAPKPYISSSNYIMKMSDYKKGEWQKEWDALFWRFMHVHRDLFAKNPRLSMLLSTFDKWPVDKRNIYLDRAEEYLKGLDG
ncbi:MAG: cryptochrome/photolyase family protein [Flavobacteriales bacterium]|nr:cryptochrome/photolyase family protein [Flavobacteriales bacterium]